jgi:hypothetical protein
MRRKNCFNKMESVEYRADKFPRWRKKRRKRNFPGGEEVYIPQGALRL